MRVTVQVSAAGVPLVQVTAAGARPVAARRGMIGYTTVTEGTSVTVRARPELESGAAILRSGVTTVTLHVTDPDAPSEPIWEQALDVAAVMATALQTGGAWPTDSIGYTFEHTVQQGADLFFEGGKRYVLEYELVLGSSPSDRVWVRAEVLTLPVYARQES